MILSVNSVFAIEDSGMNLTENLEIDSNADIELADNPADEVLTSDETVDELANADGEVLEMEVDSTPTPTIKMGKVTKRYNGAIQYKATFYNTDGKPLANQLVYFEVDDSKDYEATTDANGVALLNIFIANGNHKIAAVSMDPLCVSYDNIKVFNVLTGNKDLKVYYDGGSCYKVRVYGDNGKPVKSGQKVTFYVGSKKYTKSTDKNGYAKLKLTQKPGYYQVMAKYKDFKVSNVVLIKQVIKSVTSFSGKALKSTFKYKVKFLGKNKKNKKIMVKFNKKTYKAKTNKKGIATFTLKTPKKTGSYNVVASYKKSKISSTFTRYVAR